MEDAGVLMAIKCHFTLRVSAPGQVSRVAACLVEILRDLRFGNSTMKTFSLLCSKPRFRRSLLNNWNDEYGDSHVSSRRIDTGVKGAARSVSFLRELSHRQRKISWLMLCPGPVIIVRWKHANIHVGTYLSVMKGELGLWFCKSEHYIEITETAQGSLLG